jgi:hypothetical protein
MLNYKTFFYMIISVAIIIFLYLGNSMLKFISLLVFVSSICAVKYRVSPRYSGKLILFIFVLFAIITNYFLRS